MSLVPCQPCSVAAVAATALYGEDIWLPLTIAACPSVAPAWGTDPSLESCQPPQSTPEETLLADTLGMLLPGLEAGQGQPTVLETRTKDPLTDEGTVPIII